MKLKVRYNEFMNWPEEVPVTVKEEGVITYCNHAIKEPRSEDFGYADPIKCDWVSDYQAIEVCRKCQSWRFIDGEWEEGSE